jgi:hypothetical protein
MMPMVEVVAVETPWRWFTTANTENVMLKVAGVLVL